MTGGGDGRTAASRPSPRFLRRTCDSSLWPLLGLTLLTWAAIAVAVFSILDAIEP